MDRLLGEVDLDDALTNWDRQRDQVALIHQAFALTLPKHGNLVRGLQAHHHHYEVADVKFAELQLEAAERLAAEIRELVLLARKYQSLNAAFESQRVVDEKRSGPR